MCDCDNFPSLVTNFPVAVSPSLPTLSTVPQLPILNSPLTPHQLPINSPLRQNSAQDADDWLLIDRDTYMYMAQDFTHAKTMLHKLRRLLQDVSGPTSTGGIWKQGLVPSEEFINKEIAVHPWNFVRNVCA